MTLHDLIEQYQHDPDSPFHRCEWRTRCNYASRLRRWDRDCGQTALSDLNARVILACHRFYSGAPLQAIEQELPQLGPKIAVAHSMIMILRNIVTFGATILEQPDCLRLALILHRMRFPGPGRRTTIITAPQATAIRAAAHARGWHSIALAQATAFDGIFRQTDMIGMWVPIGERGVSDIVDRGTKWLSGIRWDEIAVGANLVLTHITNKKKTPVTVNLSLAPMVSDEFARMPSLPTSGPYIVAEDTGLPYRDHTFRRRWRELADSCGVPKAVYNMDTRAGAITEATAAGADLEHIRHASQHRDIRTVQIYARGGIEKAEGVLRQRVAHRITQPAVAAAGPPVSHANIPAGRAAT